MNEERNYALAARAWPFEEARKTTIDYVKTTNDDLRDQAQVNGVAPVALGDRGHADEQLRRIRGHARHAHASLSADDPRRTQGGLERYAREATSITGPLHRRAGGGGRGLGHRDA
jgi:hypothetical protein